MFLDCRLKISPASGSVTGGNNVVISSNGEKDLRDVIGVKWGEKLLTEFTLLSNHQLAVITPPGIPGVVSISLVRLMSTNCEEKGFYSYLQSSWAGAITV